MSRILAFAAAAMLFATPIAFAQTTPPSNPPPATNPAPTTHTTPTTPPAAGTMPGSSSTATPGAMPSASNMSQQGTARCPTRHAVGERCSCRSAPTDMGVSADVNGRHMCMVQ